MKRKLIIAIGLAGLILLPLIWVRLVRPWPSDQQVELFQGVSYQRRVLAAPRPLLLHVLQVDLNAPGLRLLATPGDTSGGMEVMAQTTAEFAEATGVQAAINGGFFMPSYYRRPWDFYPRSGEPTNVGGLAISDGQLVSPPQSDWPTLCVSAANEALIAPVCPAETEQAVSGNVIFVAEAAPVPLDGRRFPGRANYARRNPRTAVALDQSRETLWLIVVDGRQPGYSEGVTLPELAQLALGLGAHTALNLDGGGSTTMVIHENGRVRTVNAPIDFAIPGRQRPVANHLGVYALPLD